MNTATNTNNYKLKVLSLNIWGVPVFSAERRARVEAIAGKLREMQLDLAGIQEAWVESDRKLLAEKAGLPFSYYYPSGIQGSGLLLLSRYPIVDAGFHRFRLTSRPGRFPHEQEYFGGKGIGLARVLTPGGPVDVYNVHPIAQYTADELDIYKTHRAAAAYECARLINTHSRENPVILTGDLNMRPDQFAYKALVTLAGLTDVYAALHPGEPGVTYSPENPYASPAEDPKRLDYVFTRRGSAVRLKAVSACVTLTKIDTPSPRGYTDHYGVLAELEMEKGPDVPEINQAEDAARVLEEIAGLLRETLAEARKRRKAHLAKWAGAGGISLALNLLRHPNAYLKAARGLARSATGAYATVQGWLSLFIMPEEIHALQAILGEIELQLQARQAFNGAPG